MNLSLNFFLVLYLPFLKLRKKKFASIFLWIPMKMSKKCNIWLVAYLIKSKTKINLEKALILAKKANSIRKLHLFSAFYFIVPTDNAQCSRPQQVKIGGEVAATTST